jgi:ribosome maturation factor RimP
MSVPSTPGIPGDIQGRLAGLLAEPIEALGLDLEAVDLSKAGKRSVLRVAVDKDGGVDLDDVAAATREVSRLLDESDVMGGGSYTLEVSSPGVDRPLTLPRHWRRNTGRLVTVAVGPAGSAEQVTARVLEVDGDGVTLAVEAKGKPGAKKRPPTRRQVPWQELGTGRVQVEFGRHEPGADGEPQDATAQPDPADDDDGGGQ